MACKGNCNEGRTTCSHKQFCAEQEDDFEIKREFADWLGAGFALVLLIITFAIWFE